MWAVYASLASIAIGLYYLGNQADKSFVDGVYGLSRRDADFVFAAGSAVRFSACRLVRFMSSVWCRAG